MPYPSTQNFIDAFACALSVLAVCLACKVLATLANCKVIRDALRRVRMSSARCQSLPLCHDRQPWESLCTDRQPWESLCSNRIVAADVPETQSAPVACNGYLESSVILGGFEVIIFRPIHHRHELHTVSNNTVRIAKFSAEPGTGNLIIVTEATECRVSNCNLVSVSEKSQHVSMTCSYCRNVNITCAMQCVSENARQLQVRSCFSLLHRPTDPCYFAMNCAIGCTENVMHASPCIVTGRRVETVNMPGLYLEYDLELQRLKVRTEMKLEISNVDSVEIKDSTTCEITHAHSVQAHDIFSYTGNENEFENLDRCNSVEFCSLHAANAVKSSKCVATHGQCTNKVYNVTF